LKDLPEVKVGAVKHIAQFLECLDQDTRVRCIEIIYDLQKDADSWRIRKLLARQIGHLSRLFELTEVSSILIPLALQLVKDEVYCVRKAAAPQVQILKIFVLFILVFI